MTESAQSYKSHKRWVPLFHFFALPVLIVNVGVATWQWNQLRTGSSGWQVVVAVALLVAFFLARDMTLTAQNRVIRLEERMRLASLMPDDMRGRVNELRPGHLVGLRFASDDEVVALSKRCLDGELKTAGDVKKEIKSWRPDYLRV